MFGLTLELIEWMTQGEKNGSESPASVRGKCRIAVLFRHLEGATRHIDPLPEGTRPRDDNGEEEIGLSYEVIQFATSEQIAGHPSESITFTAMAEAGAGDH